MQALLSETRVPLAPKRGRAERYDYEYVREGCASAFMIYAPLEGRREVYIAKDGRRTQQAYARALELIATVMFPNAEKIVLVEDNLNTHRDASLYATFEASRARLLAERFERHNTPKHGSWLNIAEIEISAFALSCLPHRVGKLDQFKACVEAGVERRNTLHITTDWQFTNQYARTKLKRCLLNSNLKLY